MDFVHDALADGRPFRARTVVDQWSRQSPILEVAASLSGATVGATVGVALDRVLLAAYGLRLITVDHGTEFPVAAFEDRAVQRGVQLDFIRPDKPEDAARRQDQRTGRTANLWRSLSRSGPTSSRRGHPPKVLWGVARWEWLPLEPEPAHRAPTCRSR
jgi:hypothetical protein